MSVYGNMRTSSAYATVAIRRLCDAVDGLEHGTLYAAHVGLKNLHIAADIVVEAIKVGEQEFGRTDDGKTNETEPKND